jgi:protein involved in polysaccharide export with SLBB domain
MMVLGKTREEATELLREAYGELYFDPEVSLMVVEARSRFFTVMGDVQQPAQYPYSRPMSILDGINQAGGIRISQQGGDTFVGTQGQLMKAIVIREVEGQRTATEVDLRDIQRDGPHPGNTPMLPGDLIYVPEGINLVYLLGEGVRSRALALREGMTLLQLLANAGGFSESVTRMQNVVVMREVSKGETQLMLCDLKNMLKTGEQFIVQAGDIIYLPRKRLVNLADFMSRLYSPINQTIGVSRQVMGLYTQAYDTYYTKDRFDRLFNEEGSSVNTLSVLQTIRDLNDFGNELVPTLATE